MRGRLPQVLTTAWVIIFKQNHSIHSNIHWIRLHCFRSVGWRRWYRYFLFYWMPLKRIRYGLYELNAVLFVSRYVQRSLGQSVGRASIVDRFQSRIFIFSNNDLHSRRTSCIEKTDAPASDVVRSYFLQQNMLSKWIERTVMMRRDFTFFFFVAIQYEMQSHHITHAQLIRSWSTRNTQREKCLLFNEMTPNKLQLNRFI